LLKRRILHRDYCSIGKIAIERKEQAGKDGLLFSGSTAILSLFIIPQITHGKLWLIILPLNLQYKIPSNFL
ncbi:hypothetical protein, partial [Tepidanaerobacter acetatoxydans]|uniref:hypothetical protein n=1 Tax=Tepidanaerobacter acetatoxydans TaxID=499229 RepID=UPI0026EE80C8